MINRGARAERQVHLRLLESRRLATEEQLKQLKAKYAAMPILLAEQQEKVLTGILAMSPDALVQFFQHHGLRVAQKHWHGMPRNTQHGDDLDPIIRRRIRGCDQVCFYFCINFRGENVSLIFQFFPNRCVIRDGAVKHDSEIYQVRLEENGLGTFHVR